MITISKAWQAVWLIIATSLMTGGNAAAQEPATTAYFATLPFRESPFDILTGIHPISASVAAQRNHYRFDYDQHGRPVRVAYMLGDSIRDLDDSAGYYFHAPRVDISYESGIERRSFFDRHGNQINADGDVFTEIYALDSLGYRQSLRFLDVDGRPAENSWGVARYEWQRHEDGTVVERRYTRSGELARLRGSFPFYEIHLHYGPGGWIALMQNFGREGVLTMNELNAAQDRLEFNASGDLLAWNVLDTEGRLSRGNGPNVARGIMVRDAWGLEIVERYEDEHGNPITSGYGWSFTRSTRDRFGNRVERSNYTLDGQDLLISPDRGYAGVRYSYDESGRNLTRAAFFDAQHQPAVRAGQGYTAISFQYDAHGNRVRARYEDAHGALVNRSETGVAQVEFSYDSRHRLTQTLYRNASGELVALPSGHAIERRHYGEYGVAIAVTCFDSDDQPVGFDDAE